MPTNTILDFINSLAYSCAAERVPFSFCSSSIVFQRINLSSSHTLSFLAFITSSFRIALSAPRSSFTSTPQAVNNDFLKFILSAQLGKNAAQSGFCAGHPISLFVILSGNAVVACTAALSGASCLGRNHLLRNLHGYHDQCGQKSGQLAVRALPVQDQLRALTFFYSFVTSKNTLETLIGLYTISFYAWDLRAVLVVCRLAGFRSASFLDPDNAAVA